MRHPYFKECREQDARRSQQGNASSTGQTETSRSAQPVRSGASDAKSSSKNNEQQQGGKALPSISGSNTNYDARTEVQKNPPAQSQNDHSHASHVKNTLKTNAAYQQQGHAHGVQQHTLPPIGGGGNANSTQGSNQGKYFFTDGNRNGGNTRNNNVVAHQPKKKKKV